MGRVRSLLAALFLLFALAGPAAAQGSVYLLELRGDINPVTARYVVRALEVARREGAEAVILQLDTPGGLMDSMRQIVQAILDSPVPVVVYVAPAGARAGSAGVFVTYAAHVAAMAPGTNLGAAHPVSLGGGEEGMDETMAEKVTNDAAAQIRALAQLRGRNVEWGEQAVRESASATAEEALELGVVDLIAPDLPALLEALDGREVETIAGVRVLRTRGAVPVPLPMTWVERFLNYLANPNIAYLLLSLGTLAILYELSNPGAILPGVAGGIALILGFFALQVLPFNAAGLALMAFAFVLFGLEVFVTSHGILGIGGVVAFILGSLLLFDVPGAEGLRISRSVLLGTSSGIALLVGILVWLVAQGQRRRPAVGAEALLGQRAQVRRAIPAGGWGMIFLEGALWQARSEDGGPIPEGAWVQVVGVEGLRLTVRRIDTDSASP